jgi:hypothetical protein
VDVFDRHSATLVRAIDLPPWAASSSGELSFCFGGDQLLVGAPSFGDGPAPDLNAGEAFLFDIPTGALLHHFSNSLGVPEFGAAVAMNDRYIVIGAPGLPPDTTKLLPPERGGFEVFDRTTYGSVWKKTTRAEYLGSCLALDGDELWVGGAMSTVTVQGVRLKYAGGIHRFEIPRRRLVATVSSPEPRVEGGFGVKFRVADGRLVAEEPRTFHDLALGQWFRIDPPVAGLPFLGGSPVISERYFAASHGQKIELFEFDTGRLRIGGPASSFENLRISEDDWLYWHDWDRAYGLPMALLEGFASWLELRGKTVDDFDEYLEETGALFSLGFGMDGGEALPGGLAPQIAGLPHDARAVIERSTDLSDWVPTHRRTPGGEWLPLEEGGETEMPCLFHRLRVSPHPAYEELREAP